jgi:FHS family L-fucose permease-like MFS transporter
MAKPPAGLRHYPLALLATFALFATWGFAHRIYEAIAPQFAQFFHLTGPGAALSQSVFTASFFMLAIPACLFLRRFGYKLGVVFGLSSFSVGALLLYPAITQHEYLYFVSAVIVLGAGWAWLETSANPLIVELGTPETAVRRLNLAQSCYPVGVVAGFEIGRWLTQMDLSLPAGQLAQAVVRPYVIVGLCVLMVAFLIENIEFPGVATERLRVESKFREEVRVLLSRPMFRADAGALAACIFAHVGLWVYMMAYMADAFPQGIAITAAELMLLMFLVYGAGRIVGSALMHWIEPNILLAVCAGASVLLTAAAVATGGSFGVFCLISTNFFMSIMFPTIFATSIRDLGPLKRTASGLLVTGEGIAATLVPFCMSSVVGISNVRLAIMLPCFAFAVVFIYAQALRRERPSTTSDATAAGLARQE